MHKLTRKRQVTIPKAVCNELGLEPGNLVEIFARDGVSHLVRMSNESLAGKFAHLITEHEMPTEKELKEAIKSRVKRKFDPMPTPGRYDDRS